MRIAYVFGGMVVFLLLLVADVTRIFTDIPFKYKEKTFVMLVFTIIWALGYSWFLRTFHNTCRLYRNGKKVIGIITDISYFPTKIAVLYEFKVNDVMYEHVVSVPKFIVKRYSEMFVKGKEITVLYEKDDPENSTIKIKYYVYVYERNG